MSELAEWDSFYLIVGGAAGALIGLQFVVMTLIADRPVRVADVGAAFVTPTIVHFSTALLLAALLRAPWHGITPVAALWGVTGICGVAYTTVVAHRMRSQAAYQPVFEDWLFHVLLPLAGYAILALSAFMALYRTRLSLFGVGATALLLLFVGIHNAWDGVAYQVFVNKPDAEAGRVDLPREDGQAGSPPSRPEASGDAQGDEGRP